MKPALIAENYRVGIYVRESRDENEENYETIETQRDLLIDFVSRNKLGEICRVYVDDNVSGSIFERDGMDQLKADIVAKTINLLVSKDLSRLGRNNAKTLLFLDFLEEYGVRVITFDGKYDSTKDNDTVGIETWFNERYIRDISKKIRTNLRFKIEKGEYIGHAPFGYIKSNEFKNRLRIDEDKAKIIKEIFSLYKEGYGYAYISKYLNRKGYPPPSQKVGTENPGFLWNAVSIKRIISNRVYVGDTIQGISEKISFKSKKTRRLPIERQVLTENTHEGIISREEFEEVQRIKAEKSTIRQNHKGTIHLFKSILYCGKCESIMFARVRKNRSIGYVCGAYFKNGIKTCSSHYIKEITIENILLDELMKLFSDKAVFDNAKVLLEKSLSKETDASDRFLKLEQQISSKQMQQDILYMDKLEGKISEQLFLRMNSNIENRISQLRHETEKVKLRCEQHIDIDGLMQYSINELKDKGLSNEIIKLFVKRIFIFEEGDECKRNIDPNLDINVQNKGAVIIEFNYNSS